MTDPRHEPDDTLSTRGSSLSPDTVLTAPAGRGSTTLEDAVVEHIADHAASEVPGVVRSGSGVSKALGRQYPKTTAHVAGDRARVHVEVAVAWPYPLADTCAAVRDRVTLRLAELTGLKIDAADITAAEIVHPTPPPTRRVQ